MGATMAKNGAHFLDIPSQGTLHVVMLGLDSAGKTTALYRLKFDQYLNTVPTIGFNCEKVIGSSGKAKGVQFLIWDVGGQEKLRPLWRSYTRCTDGILFVVDSVDVERMEEAKMELMRTAKCPDNQGVPVLILANKQDLPGARDTKELEKLLGLFELVYPAIALSSMGSSSSASTGNIVGSSSNCTHGISHGLSLTPTAQHNKTFAHGVQVLHNDKRESQKKKHLDGKEESSNVAWDAAISNKTVTTTSVSDIRKHNSDGMESSSSAGGMQYKGWYIQPACAITGEGLQEGLEALYDMVLKRRKLNKAFKRKR